MTVVLKPRMTEKTYALALTNNTYVFDVVGDSNKVEIAKLVQERYSVTPENVRIAIIKGKSKRSYKKGGRFLTGKRNDTKKAYVRIKDGESLPFFADIQAQEEKEKKAEEKAAKKAKKEGKK